MDRSGVTAGLRRIGRYARAIGRVHPRRGVQFLARAAVHWTATTRWLGFLDAEPLAAAPFGLRLELAQRVQRPFSRDRFTAAERARLLMDHYDLLAGRLGPASLRAFLCSPGLELARLAGRRGEIFRLVLCRDNRYAKEGELTFGLLPREDGPALATLTCVLARDEAGKAVLSIGGLQGPPRSADRRAIAAATRALDGLRPKHAVLEAARAFARWFPVAAMIATSLGNHVHGGMGRDGTPIRADYAGFWREQGGVERTDGDYALPLQVAIRPVTAVESKRRAQWQRRRKRHDRIAQETAAALDALAASQDGGKSTAIRSPGRASSAESRAA